MDKEGRAAEDASNNNGCRKDTNIDTFPGRKLRKLISTKFGSGLILTWPFSETNAAAMRTLKNRMVAGSNPAGEPTSFRYRKIASPLGRSRQPGNPCARCRVSRTSKRG